MDKNLKPWEHALHVGINWVENLDGTRDADGMRAYCTCGQFSFPFQEGMDPAVVLQHTTPHMDTHPMHPVSTAALGDESVVLVMAVPGPDSNPVHMSISVSREVYDDGDKLAHHLGTIGSPLHFQILEQHAHLSDRMNSTPFRAFPMPPGEGVGSFVDMLQQIGFTVRHVGDIQSDGSISVPEQKEAEGEEEQGIGQFPTIGKKPEGWPGFRQDYGTFTTHLPIEHPKTESHFRFEDDSTWKQPSLPLDDIGPRGDEPRPDFDDPDEYAP